MAEVTAFLVGAAVALAVTLLVRWRPWGRQPELAAELTRFFGGSPAQLPIVSRGFSPVDLPNLHVAITVGPLAGPQ